MIGEGAKNTYWCLGITAPKITLTIAMVKLLRLTRCNAIEKIHITANTTERQDKMIINGT